MAGIDSNVISLLHCNEYPFTDYKNNSIITNTGIGATLDTTNKKFGTGSLYFNGSSILTISNSNFDFSKDFSVDFWVSFKENVTTDAHFFQIRNASGGFVLFFNNYELYYWDKNVEITTIISGVTLGRFYHIEFTCSNNKFYIFVNGVEKFSSYNIYNNYIANLTNIIFGGRYDNDYNFVGNVDEIRISNIARHTSDFSIPTRQYNDFKCMFTDNTNYYNLQNYNSSTKEYEPNLSFTISDFDTKGFDIEELFEDVTVNGETFKPYDKLKKYTLVSNKVENLIVKALKVNKSMICTLEPISMKKFKTIHSITGDYIIKNSSVIKLLFSFDKGTTWKTYDVSGSAWKDVNVDIPIRLYENFSDTDKTNWDTARDTILSDGISVQNLGNVEFESVRTDKLMFAVAFNRPSYADTCTLKGLNINYDGLETYIQLACGSDLSKYEAMVSITGDSVEVKTASNQDKILVTMTTNI